MTKDEARVIQSRLNSLGYDAGLVDGDWGKRSDAALRHFQKLNGLNPDGVAGKLTMAALGSPVAKRSTDDGDPRIIDRSISMAPPPARLVTAAEVWPHQRDVAKFFGPPGGSQCTAGVVRLPIQFKLAWDLSSKISQFKCHVKVADAFTRVFNSAVDHYGEAGYRGLRLDLFGGCYNFRQMRGGSAYSMHSWGIAVDLDPERNQLKWGAKATATTPAAEFAKPEYAAFWQIVEREGLISLGRAKNFDWMHFQAARL